MFAPADQPRHRGALHDYGCTSRPTGARLENIELYGTCTGSSPPGDWSAAVDEVVVRHHARQFGNPSTAFRDRESYPDLMTVSFLLRYSRSPIQIFGKSAGCRRAGPVAGAVHGRRQSSANLFGTGSPPLLKRPSGDDFLHAGFFRHPVCCMGTWRNRSDLS